MPSLPGGAPTWSIASSGQATPGWWCARAGPPIGTSSPPRTRTFLAHLHSRCAELWEYQLRLRPRGPQPSRSPAPRRHSSPGSSRPRPTRPPIVWRPSPALESRLDIVLSPGRTSVTSGQPRPAPPTCVYGASRGVRVPARSNGPRRLTAGLSKPPRLRSAAERRTGIVPRQAPSRPSTSTEPLPTEARGTCGTQLCSPRSTSTPSRSSNSFLIVTIAGSLRCEGKRGRAPLISAL